MSERIEGLSNELYHHGATYRDYLSSSQLKLYAKSPKHARYQIDNPQEETAAQHFGSLFHDLMASLAEAKGEWSNGYGEWLDGLAIFDPPFNTKTGQAFGATTNIYKEAYQQFVAENGCRNIVKEEDADLAAAMAHSLLHDCGQTSGHVRKLLEWAKGIEVSYFYETENGIKLKIRPDLLTRDKIVDWKTCIFDSLDEETIARQIVRYGYHISLSMYQWVLHEITGKWYRPYLVFVSKVAPYDCVVCDISAWCFTYYPEVDMISEGIGAQEFKRLLDLHTECVKNNEWPGAESAVKSDSRIMIPAVPMWLERRHFEEY